MHRGEKFERMKNRLLKLLCLTLSMSVISTAIPVGERMYTLDKVYAAEASLEYMNEDRENLLEEAQVQESVIEEDMIEESAEEGAASESDTSKDILEEAMTEATTSQESPEETLPEDASEEGIPESTLEESVSEGLTQEIMTEEWESEMTTTEEITEEETETEETAEVVDEEQAFLLELLEKARKRYPDMYMNDAGLFEYVDETGTLYTYDPYDPEFGKYVLEDVFLVEEELIDDYAGTSSGNTVTTVSPFTGKVYTQESHVSDRMIRHGIDVSKHQGTINWTKARAAGVEFAIVRVGYRGYGAAGNIGSDEYAVQNIKNAYNAGVKVGVYIFSQAITEAEAQEEAQYCYNFLKNNGLEKYVSLPVFIDYEYYPNGRLQNANLTDAKRQAICDKFCNVIKQYGYEPGIYANYSMFTSDLTPTKSSAYEYICYWLARYNSATNYSNKYSFWQYSSKGTVDGINGNVDCNFWYDNKKNISSSTIRVSIGDECDYYGDVKELISLYDTSSKYTLVEEKDYAITTFQTEQNGVLYTCVGIAGIGNYEGTITKLIKMTQVSLTEEMISGIETQTFTGNPITTTTGLSLSINHAGEQLEEGKDYSVSYENNVNIGTAIVTITGQGNYTGEIQKKFQIKPMTLSEEMLSKIEDVYYNGSKITTQSGLVVEVHNPNTDGLLQEKTDYILAYTANQNAGIAKLTITGKGNYTGKLTTTFTILKAGIANDNTVITIGGKAEGYTVSYTGRAIKPAVAVTVNGVLLKKTEYTVEYVNNKDVSKQACVVIKGKTNYEGTAVEYFTIEPKMPAPIALTTNMVSLESEVIRANGSSIIPEICVVQNGSVLVENTDYTVSYLNAKKQPVTEIVEAGIYYIKITGIGGYKNSVLKKLEIIANDKKLIGKEYTDVTLATENDYVYTGKGLKPELKVIDKTSDNKELKMGVDYTVTYLDNVKAGVARFTITGRGEYKGTYTGTWTIQPINMGNLVQTQEGTPIKEENAVISLSKYTFNYNGKTQKPILTIKYDKKTLKEGTDYEITYTAVNTQSNAIYKSNADTYEVNVTFKGNYAGTAKIDYMIAPIDISKINISVPKQQYNGTAICPSLSEMTVKLGNVKLDTEALNGVIINNWTNNVNVGNKATFALTVTTDDANFMKNTTKNVSFTILARSVTDKYLTYTIGGMEVDGNKSNLELIYNNGVELNQTNGAEVCVKDILTGNILTEGVDYTLKYSNNKKVGNANVVIKGIGGYKGSKTITFKITGKPIGNGQVYDDFELVMSDAENYVYSGKAISPIVDLYEGSTLLKKNKDYTIKYQNNINAGTATITIYGKGNYAGIITQNFVIQPKKATDAKNVKISNIANQVYTGKVIIPRVTVTVDGKTLVKGKDYTMSVLNSTRLTYEDSQGKKGNATVIITGIGNYKGILIMKSFTVVEKK